MGQKFSLANAIRLAQTKPLEEALCFSHLSGPGRRLLKRRVDKAGRSSTRGREGRTGGLRHGGDGRRGGGRRLGCQCGGSRLRLEDINWLYNFRCLRSFLLASIAAITTLPGEKKSAANSIFFSTACSYVLIRPPVQFRPFFLVQVKQVRGHQIQVLQITR